jgi:glycosyltransferase involved in cell wall biosynthesis
LPDAHIVSLAADDPPDEPRTSLAESFFAGWPALRDKRLILFLSRIHPKKGLDLLIPACAELMRTRADVRLVMVGPGETSYVRSLQRRAAAVGVGEQIVWTGPLTGRSKWSALAAADVFALPSYQENFAIVVAEAMQMAVPVVLSRCVNIWEDVTTADAGSACDLDPKSVADQIARYLDDPVLARATGERGRELVRTTFTWERSAQACERMYEGVLSRTLRSPRKFVEPTVQSKALSS